MILLLFFPYTYSKTCHKVFFATGSLYMKVPGDSLESPDHLSCFVVPPPEGEGWEFMQVVHPTGSRSVKGLRVNKMKPDKEGRHPAGL
ncbi:MAG: hypothetical protein D3910_00920 [Candidatus Electrothrix sp. ATG2]|nr:hypothetical protein [Candidatus Electrothrix sp. ATG2]